MKQKVDSKRLDQHCSFQGVEWSLDGPFPKLCPVIPTSNQDGHQAKNRKGGMKFKKNLLLWNYWANLNQTLLKWSLDGPLPNFVWHFRPPIKMATRGPSKDHSTKVWLKLAQWLQRSWLKCEKLTDGRTTDDGRSVVTIAQKGALDSQSHVIKLTSWLPMVGGSLRVLRLLPSLKLITMI
jgi:hypothetical protein